MAISKYEKVITRLSDKTTRGELEWQETPQGGGYQVSFPDYSLVIEEKPGESFDTPDFVITIINSEGTVLDEFSDVNLQRIATDDGRDSNYFKMMQELHQTARRQALGVDQALDAILQELS